METQTDIPNASPSLALVRGSKPRALSRHEAKKLIQREGHNLVLHDTKDGYANDPAFHWLCDLRRKQRHVWGGMLRWIDRMVDRGYSEQAIQIIPDLLRAYIRDQFDGGRAA